MKLIKIYLTVFIICGLALPAKINAQERSSSRQSNYMFEFKHVAKNDTLHTLYCVVTLSYLSDFEKVSLSYNDKTKIFITKNLLRDKSEEYFIEGNYIFFNIKENLVEPFVIITGMDKAGNKYNINERNAKGKVINSMEEKERWKKSIARIDSMDYVRQFDDVYVGKDGKPRFKDHSGNVYIIEKDHTKHE